MAGSTHAFRIPASLRHDVEQIFTLTDPFCAEHLDAEYAELVRKLVAKLARKRPSPLARGNLRIWAAGSAEDEVDRRPSSVTRDARARSNVREEFAVACARPAFFRVRGNRRPIL